MYPWLLSRVDMDGSLVSSLGGSFVDLSLTSTVTLVHAHGAPPIGVPHMWCEAVSTLLQRAHTPRAAISVGSGEYRETVIRKCHLGIDIDTRYDSL